MAYLSYPSPAAMQLRLDTQDDALFQVVRGCTWWTNAEIEGRLPGSTRVTQVTLTTTRAMDGTLRSILETGFGLVFPVAGGAGRPRVSAPVVPRRKKRSVRP